jgi:hypothetical protein
LKEKFPSEELSNKKSESESETETSGMSVDGWKEVTMGSKTLKAYTHLLRILGHILTFCQMLQSPWIILVNFSMMSV